MSEMLTKPVKRRDFLGIVTIGTFAVAMAAALAGILRFFRPTVFSELSKKYKIGKPGGFPLGEVRVPPGRSVYVFHDESGFYAISSRCTHLGCIVKRGHDEFLCPCHGSRFKLNGDVISGAATRALDWYDVSMAPDGQLVVDEGKKVKKGTVFFA